MAEEFHIGELAKRSGRSIHTIRWYETQGLIPNVRRDNGGRRIYSVPHLNFLKLLNRLRNTGMSISEMRKYTQLVANGRKTVKKRKQLLQNHREKVMQTIEEWKLSLNLIDKKIEFYEEWDCTGERPKFDPIDK